MALLLLAAYQSLPVVAIEDLMRQGQDLYAQKRYDEAIRRFADALAKDARYWPAHLGIARAQIDKGAWVPAVTSARQAWQISPQGADVVSVFSQALFGAGESALKAGVYGESITFFGEYIRIQPGNPAAHVNIARAYLGERKFADALASLLRTIQASGDVATRQETLALLLEGARQALVQNDTPSVIGFLREYLKYDATNLRAWLDLGKSLWESGEPRQALEAFKRVLELSPRHEEALRFMLQR